MVLTHVFSIVARHQKVTLDDEYQYPFENGEFERPPFCVKFRTEVLGESYSESPLIVIYFLLIYLSLGMSCTYKSACRNCFTSSS